MHNNVVDLSGMPNVHHIAQSRSQTECWELKNLSPRDKMAEAHRLFAAADMPQLDIVLLNGQLAYPDGSLVCEQIDIMLQLNLLSPQLHGKLQRLLN